MPTSIPLPAVVFDFGGVLINWDPRFLYRKLFDDEQIMERFLEEIHFHEWNVQQDAGRPFTEAVEELCGRFPQYCELIHAYNERYMESLSEPLWGTVEIMRRLRASGCRLYGLSNWPEEKFIPVRAKYDFFELFDDIVLSGVVRLTKPDPRIFGILLERVGRPAGECLLIDDHAPNIAAARGLGFQAIQFKNPAQLQEQLDEKGLLV